MAKKNNDKNKIVRENWMNNFTLIGRYAPHNTFIKTDEKSENSNWQYSNMTLGVDCGEKCGIVTADMVGGFSLERENVIYAHGKNEDGSDDYSNQILVAWEDRFDENILESIGDRSFIVVGLEFTDKKKVFYKKFLSAYDAIPYIEQTLDALSDDAVIKVRGSLKYSLYNDVTQVNKQITQIYIDTKSKEEDFTAKFVQSILVDSDSIDKNEIDKERGLVYINARVLDYVKEINGKDISGQYPFSKVFEFYTDLNDKKKFAAIMSKLFKPKKNIRQVTFNGLFVEGGATVTTTYEDVPDDVKELVDIGVYTEEEAIAACSTGGSRERHMVLTKPYIKNTDGTSIPQIFDDVYTEDDLSSNIDTDDNEEVSSEEFDEFLADL